MDHGLPHGPLIASRDNLSRPSVDIADALPWRRAFRFQARGRIPRCRARTSGQRRIERPATLDLPNRSSACGRVSMPPLMTPSQPLRLAAFRRLATTYTLNELAWAFGTVALAVIVYDRSGSGLATMLLFVATTFVPAVAAP